MIPTWLKLSSIVCSSAGDTLSCAGRPTGPGISSLTYTTTSGHHRRYLPDFPEITGQSFRNPQLLDRDVGRFGPFENLVHIGRSAPKQVWKVCPIRHQAACLHEIGLR